MSRRSATRLFAQEQQLLPRSVAPRGDVRAVLEYLHDVVTHVARRGAQAHLGTKASAEEPVLAQPARLVLHSKARHEES